MTAAKTIQPDLRFPEFRGDGEWAKRPLGSMSTRIRKKVGTKALTPVSITAGFGFVDQTKKFGRRIAGKQYKNYIYIKRGDFVYNKGNSKTFAQGCIYQLKEFDEAAASTAFICFKLDDGCIDQYFQSLFEFNAHGRELAKFITSGARSDGLLNINPNDFFSIELPVPPQKAEQKKIADCIGSLDDLLAAHSRKLAALQDHKKGLLQNLFPAEKDSGSEKGELRSEKTPKLRFPGFEGEWETAKLGSLTKKVGSGITPRGGSSNYKATGRPFVRSQNVGWGILLLDDIVYIDEKTHRGFGSTEIMAEDVLLNITGASIGRSTVANSLVAGGNVNQHVCIIRSNPNALVPNFLCQFIISQVGQTQIDSFQAGGNRQGLNFEQVRSFLIPLPPTKKEQQKIAECLSALDALITAQTEQIAALKAHKQGLMQQLFPNPDR